MLRQTIRSKDDRARRIMADQAKGEKREADANDQSGRGAKIADSENVVRLRSRTVSSRSS